MISRADRSVFAEWWRTIDKPLLGAVLALAIAGVLLSFAASPPVAERIGLPRDHFIIRHSVFMLVGILLMIGCSLLSPKGVRRFALILFLLAIVGLIATLLFAVEIKGSRRWIHLAGFSLQPSEFVKPAFVVLAAWLFAENGKNPHIPGNLFSVLLFVIVAVLLIAQPDFGQTMLIGLVWGVLFFLAGMPWLWIAALGGLAMVGMISAYLFFPHVAGRIDRFVSGQGDNYQVETGREAIISGGWLGQGPGEGTIKRYLPDSHTDFSFAVAAEEFGIIACFALVGIFAFIALRTLSRANRERDIYVRLTISGLITLIAVQSMINIMVNLQLIPAKGMTLPFISYGGSSMLSASITMGLILALTRQRPELLRRDRGDVEFRRLSPAK